MQRTLIVMVKDPRPGRVKTRLARDIGPVAATWWFRHQTRGLLRRLRDPRWRIVLSVAPDRAALTGRAWPADLPRWPQGRGDLGARMARALRAASPGPACLIGGDIPGLGRAHIARAFALLAGHDAVFGPAEDGGFWLIGLGACRPPPRGFFGDVRWSSGHALADAMATLPGWRIALADRLRDVDTGADLRALKR